MSDINCIYCKSVADYMLEHADDYGLEAANMWILGYLHRVGKITQHYGDDKTGGVRLFKLGFKYSQIIANHQMTPEEYCKMHLVDEPPIELILLWQAIHHTSIIGELISYDEKIEEVKSSDIYTDTQKKMCVETIEYLTKWEEDRRKLV